MNPAQRAAELFRASFAAAPAAIASAPGRVNLIGEHVDYHGGYVLPAATLERTAVAVGPGGGRLRAVSERAERLEADWPPAASGRWSDYPAGVGELMRKDAAVLADGLAVAVASDVPLAMGLSSSAALEVATAAAIAAWAGLTLPPRDAAEIGWRAENEFVGMPCGLMDQIASALGSAGSALLLDCRSLEMHPVPVGVDLVLADSGEPRALRDSRYGERRREGAAALALLRPEFPALLCLVDLPPARLGTILRRLPAPLDRRVKHVVNENQRTVLAARALESGDHAAFGTLVNASHNSLRDLYECSTPRLDAIVAAARAVPRVLGARLVGAGWGGSVLVVTEPGAGGMVGDLLRADKALALPEVRLVRPGAGVRVEVS